MKRVNITIPMNLPDWLYWALRRLKSGIVAFRNPGQAQLNLLGDRDIEWSWVASQMPPGPGEALDFGPGPSYLSLIASMRDFNVIAVDLNPVNWYFVHPKLEFQQGDILKLSLPEEHFDLVINCSSIEHVGLAGRFAVTENKSDGDLQAMACLNRLMKPGAIMLLTIPLGQDAVFAPMCRVYGQRRLAQLLGGFIVERQTSWIKNQDNRWIECDRDAALNFKASAGSDDPRRSIYALGGFVLRKPPSAGTKDLFGNNG